jgi:hypothetical protein
MKKFEHTVDLLTETLLCAFASHILRCISAKTKTDPNDLASFVKGLVHSHWYTSNEFVKGCEYCQRIEHFNRPTAPGMPAITAAAIPSGISVSTKVIIDKRPSGHVSIDDTPNAC